MPITALPTPPTRSDPTNFAVRADAFLTAIVTFAVEANALQTDVNNKQATATTQAGIATTQADTATTQAGIATTQAGIATTQAGIATTEAGNAAAAYLNLDKKFLGSKASDPTLDNQGDALVPGSFYWNSSSLELKFYNGSTWATQNLVASNFVSLSGHQTIAGVKTFSSTIDGSISGNAATVTNGVYTVGDQAIAGAKTFASKLSATADSTSVGTAGSAGTFEIGAPGNTRAVASFHKSGYAINMGLDSDNVFRLGGWSQGTNVYRLTSDGSGNLVALGNITGTSDERLKEDWKPISSSFLSDLIKVKHGTYTRKDTKERQAGVSAQDMLTVLKEVVLTDANGMLSVAYGNAALLACIKLAEEVSALRTELEELKGR